MYQRALVPIIVVAAAVFVVGGLAVVGLAQATASPSTDVVFHVGEAGSVSLRTEGPDLAVVSVAPNTGWEYQVDNEPTAARVEFRSADAAGIDFDAALSSDRIVGRIRIVDTLGHIVETPSFAEMREPHAEDGPWMADVAAPVVASGPAPESQEFRRVIATYPKPVDHFPVLGPTTQPPEGS